MPADIIFPCKKTQNETHVEENSHCLMQLGSGVVKTSKIKTKTQLLEVFMDRKRFQNRRLDCLPKGT